MLDCLLGFFSIRKLDSCFPSIQTSYDISDFVPSRPHSLENLQTLNNGKSNPVTLPYSPKISSRCPRITFLLRPEITTTLNPPAALEPFAPPLGDLDLDRDRAGDMETSEPRRRRGGGDGDSDFGVRERPLPLSDIMVLE